MNSIELNFTYSRKQIVKAYQFHYNSTLHPKRDILLISLVLAASIYFLNRSGPTYFWIIIITVAILVLMTIGSVFFIFPHIIYNKARKFKEKYCLCFDEDGIYFKTSEAESNLKWSFYKTTRENNHYILLYHSKNGFTIVPKAEFKNVDDLAAFKSLLESKLARH